MRLVLLFTIILASVTLSADESFPVIVGGDENMDACMSIGIIKGKTEKGVATVRHGPSDKYPASDTLRSGRVVWLCSDNEQWVGIVYPSTNDGSCEVSSPIIREQPYRGVCSSGWIHRSDLELVAG